MEVSFILVQFDEHSIEYGLQVSLSKDGLAHLRGAHRAFLIHHGAAAFKTQACTVQIDENV